MLENTPIPMKVYEIDDMTQSDSVDHVAERAVEHQGQPRAEQKAAPRAAGPARR